MIIKLQTSLMLILTFELFVKISSPIRSICINRRSSCKTQKMVSSLSWRISIEDKTARKRRISVGENLSNHQKKLFSKKKKRFMMWNLSFSRKKISFSKAKLDKALSGCFSQTNFETFFFFKILENFWPFEEKFYIEKWYEKWNADGK